MSTKPGDDPDNESEAEAGEELDLPLVEAWDQLHRKYFYARPLQHVLIFPSGAEPQPGINRIEHPEDT